MKCAGCLTALTDDAKEDYCMDAGKIPTTIFGADSANWLAEKGINSHEDLVKRVRDTFTPTKDTFERMAEQAWSVCDCYTNYQITAPMPECLGIPLGMICRRTSESI